MADFLSLADIAAQIIHFATERGVADTNLLGVTRYTLDFGTVCVSPSSTFAVITAGSVTAYVDVGGRSPLIFSQGNEDDLLLLWKRIQQNND